jgi:hypothetical protein
MTYANIEMKEHDVFGDGIKRQAQIDPFMKPLIEQLALKFPQWTFVENASSSNKSHVNKTIEAYRFEVRDKREVLGTVDYSYLRGDKCYRIDNHRIEGMRERGSGTRTIHINKAIKHIEKFFGKKNPSEKLTEAKRLAEQTLANVDNEKSWALQHAWTELKEPAQAFITSNYESFTATVVNPNNRMANAVKDLPSKVNEYRATQHLCQKYKDKEAYIVFIEGVNYFVQRGEDPIEVKQSDELPDVMRRAIGLLKLVEDKQVVADVGVRVNETTYLVASNNVS